jgi:uncharacterized protein
MISNRTRGTAIATDARFARTSKERTRGLLDRDSMPEGEALVFERCRQVHSFGMKFEIDVLFLDRRGLVARAVSGLKPGRLTAWVPRARTVVELPAGTIARSRTSKGDSITIDQN